MPRPLEPFIATVPAQVWAWWAVGALLAWLVPFMPSKVHALPINPTRDLMIGLATVLVLMGIRALCAAPGPGGA